MKTIYSLSLFLLSCAYCCAEEWGKFSAEPIVKWSIDGRSMTLVEEFTYTTARGVIWPCPKDHSIDGASIPKVFWSVIGGPFEGKYRNASIIHDYACDIRKRPWKEVHLAFYEAMRCGDVTVAKAKLMYHAVYNFGPRWELGPKFNGPRLKSNIPDSEEIRRIEIATPSKEETEALLKYIEANDPALESLETGLIL